jgi:hypothetical protein
MTAFTHCSPVVLIPEQRRIPFVRDDVINFGGGNQMPVLQAFDAERIPGKESLRGNAPGVSVAARGGISPLSFIFVPLLFSVAVALGGIGQRRAAWIAAGVLRGEGTHLRHLPLRPNLGNELVHLRALVFIGEARMFKIRLKSAGALACRIDQAGTIAAESFKE